MFDNLLIEKYRPQTLDDIVLSEENRNIFKTYITKSEIPNIMLMGKPGIGKTSLAKILIKAMDCQGLYINASEENGIDTIRSKIMTFAQTMSLDGKIKIVLLDEADGLTNNSGIGSSAQGSLRNVMEEYAENTRFILTCNYPNRVIPALHSRCQPFDLTPPFDECIKRCATILKEEKIKVNQHQRSNLIKLIKTQYPDMRRIIGSIQKYTVDGALKITKEADVSKFAEKVFEQLQSKKADTFKLREMVIQNEILFNNDYHDLLKSLFEITYNSGISPDKKRMSLLILSEAMYKHQQVMDFEINFFACMLALSEL
jgi:DNA polymerase III delta prime subunit